MRKKMLAFVVTSLFVGAIPASAQRGGPVPNTGMWAVGGSVGGGMPTDPSLAGGFDLAGNVEGYVTPRLSIRGQLGGAWNDVINRGFSGTLSPMFLDGNLVYNFEGGVWHPYVTGGVGMYRYRFETVAGIGGTDTTAGLDIGGGIEYFTNRRFTVTGEFLFHDTGQVQTPVTTFNQGNFWTMTVGLKRYF